MISVGLFPWAPARTFAAGFKIQADSTGVRVVDGAPIVMDEMAPGDIALISLEVVNDSTEDFILAISSDIGEGNGSLYDKLIVVIKGEAEVYNGALSGLQEFQFGNFFAGTTQVFSMEIILPSDAGNEYQGLAVNYTFKIVESDDDLVHEIPSPNPNTSLPVSGTNLNFLLPLGLILFLMGLLLLCLPMRKKLK